MTALLHPLHWLHCDEIDFASYLLANEYPHIDGFQSTLLFSVLHNGGVVGTPSGQFVQILHTGSNHWVTASNRFCPPKNQVCIYDSLSTVMYNKEKRILSWLLSPVEYHCLVTYPAVQQQSNSSNCGLFAIAFAFALCCNLRSENCQFREGGLRAELVSSFRKRQIHFKTEPRLNKAKSTQTLVNG